MASIQHQQVHVSSSDPNPLTLHHTDERSSSRPNSISDPPSPPGREGKRKRLTHEASSPSITSKQRKHSQGAKGRHSIIIEPPKICTAWDANSQHDIAAARSETSSLHSEISVESFLELDEKALTKINYIVAELIATEKTYMQDLQDIVMGYMAPMELCADLFDPDLVKDIFINIKPIGDFHMNFLEKLDEYRKDLDSLADCFLTKESEEGFALYNEFCRKVPRSLDLISAMMKDPQSQQFIQDCKQQLNHFFPLSEFLHRPIQRILKYPLLLRDLVKYTCKTKYAAGIEAALDKITGVAIHINKVKRVQELESHEILGWTGEPLLEYGVLKLEQAFKVNGTDGRYLFLFEKLLLFTKQKDGKYQYKAHLLPSEIGMTEGDKNEVKFEIEKFKAKKSTKFVVVAPTLEIKATWVYEIKRAVLENQDNITPQMREVLLKGIPSMDKTNQFNDILHNSKYTSFIYLQGFEQNEAGENGPPTPDLDNSTENRVTSPTLKTSPPPESNNFHYASPSPDRQIHDDSGIEDPAPKNTVDYSSLDVKAIKDRWKQQEKLASSNTAPVRNFHRRMSPSSTAKMETWPLPDSEENPSDILKRNIKSGGEASSKPCLARISHLQEAKEKSGPVKRDIQALLAEDAAKSQTHYDMVSPDSNTHPDCEGGNLFSALDNSRHQVVSPKQSNGSDEVFVDGRRGGDTVPDGRRGGDTIRTNLNDKKENKKYRDQQEALELSDNDEMIVKFTKGCNISGTSTAKRNSFMIEKDLQKTVPMFSPHSSDSETASESEATAARVDKIKRLADKHKLKIKAETEEETEPDSSLTDTLVGLYDQESSKCRISPGEEEEVVNKMSRLTTKSKSPSPTKNKTPSPTKNKTPSPKFSGRSVKTSPKKEDKDRTLTKDNDTLTRDQDTLTRENIMYKGSSLIRGGTPDENEIVMKPQRDKAVMKPVRDNTASPRTLTRNRIHRRAGRRGGKQDSDSESEDTSSSSKSSASRNRSSGLPKPSAIRTASGASVNKSDSGSSGQSYRGRVGSNKSEARSSNTTKPVSGSVVQSATVKKAALRTRTPSFNQDDNPFSRPAPCSRKDSDPGIKSPIKSPQEVTSPRKSVGTPTKSFSTDNPIARPSRAPGTRQCTEGLAADRRSAYLNAAQSSTTSSKNDKPVRTRLDKKESDPEVLELQSVRSSQLVARMKTQFQNNSKLRAPTRSATLKRRTERAHTTVIQPRRSQSSPATSRRASQVQLPTTTAKKPSTSLSRTATVKRERKVSGSGGAQRKPSTVTPAVSTVRESGGATTSKSSSSNTGVKKTGTISKRPSSVQKPTSSVKSAPSTRPSTTPAKTKPNSRPSSLNLQPERRSSAPKPASKAAVKTRRTTRIPSPTKSPTGVKTSASTSKVPQSNMQTAGTRPKINSASSRLQQSSGGSNRLKNSGSSSRLRKSDSSSRIRKSDSSNRLKNSGSTTRLRNSGSTSKLKTPTQLKNSASSPRVTPDSDVSDCSRASSPVKRSGIAVKTSRRPSSGFSGGRSTSMANLKDAGEGGDVSKPNLAQLRALSKSTSSVNEKSVRQARREAAQRRAAEIARSRDQDGLEGVQEMSPNPKDRMKFVYGGHRSDSRA